MSVNKQVLDACCGSRMFWFDKENADVIYMDKRSEKHILKDRTAKGGTRTLIIDPDLIGSFTDIPFPDERFSVVVYDPPHLIKGGDSGWQVKKYGKLSAEWREEIASGFLECFRVLKSGGTLIFKWNEHQIKVSEILALTDERPLMGQRCGKTAKTHWIVFMKNDDPTEKDRFNSK